MSMNDRSEADDGRIACDDRAVDDDRAADNRTTVERYLSSGHGEALRRRHELFTEDGISGLWTSDSGHPVAVQGRERIAEYDVWSSRHFPDWTWRNVRVWTTDDPDWLWAEADGGGTVILPGHDPVRYDNHFLYSFEMREGLIFREREFMNPVVEMRALGMTVPTIDLGEFPQ
ncbi:PhzA/PhzB family protein [uncultured Bifidobacterium sp.]|uniref:PhzA/PhzB family protein n=1 Tax=uncultured Bifidobacterium sp. TaxID=165187 RepID=UPI0026329EF7|nr:PhzA/PhzB family protein [uncultured Bifidobacterium sp.]